ncbi:MAG: DUF4250 domain-containing protein [Clostridium sp.]|nr:DUF4250 domain-containing protein [Clostridium sp.]MCM1547857.1 DUF4250 domain-containing protein [Ruminococcus sp.]
MELPKDPAILLSFINTMLRDKNIGLDEFCSEYCVEKTDITKKLSDIGYDYSEEFNRFK